MTISNGVKKYVKLLIHLSKTELSKIKNKKKDEFMYALAGITLSSLEIDSIKDDDVVREIIRVLQTALGDPPLPPKEVKDFINRR